MLCYDRPMEFAFSSLFFFTKLYFHPFKFALWMKCSFTIFFFFFFFKIADRKREIGRKLQYEELNSR